MNQASSLSLDAESADVLNIIERHCNAMYCIMCGPKQSYEAEEMRCSAPIDPNEWARAQELGGDGAEMV